MVTKIVYVFYKASLSKGRKEGREGSEPMARTPIGEKNRQRMNLSVDTYALEKFRELFPGRSLSQFLDDALMRELLPAMRKVKICNCDYSRPGSPRTFHDYNCPARKKEAPPAPEEKAIE